MVLGWLHRLRLHGLRLHRLRLRVWLTSAYGGADELHVSMMVPFFFFLSFKFAKNINENESLAKKKDIFFYSW